VELDQRLVATPGLAADPEAFPTIIPTDSVTIPVTWTSLNLGGRLIYSIGGTDQEDNYIIRVQALDLVTGATSVLYSAPRDAGIYYMSVSPDDKQIVMSYSPPLQSDPNIVQALYHISLDFLEPPTLLFMPSIREDQYIQAEWSPDGRYIYYTYVNYIVSDPNRIYPSYKIFRMEYPPREGVQPDLIAEEAYWPRLSPDSSRLVYVSLDPFSGDQQLKIADPDGRNAKDVVLSGPYIPSYKEAPLFSPSQDSIIFSGEVPGSSYQPNWFESLTGIRVANANGESSDWWSVPVEGGELTRLTQLQTSHLYGSVSPDNRHIVSYSKNSIFVMNPEGSELTVIISGLYHFSGTVHWIP
jgi:Tol biopolymer transport system component